MKLFFMNCLIALRNVRRNPRRSLFTTTAIAFGLFCLIIFQALKAGLHSEMILSTVQLDTGALQIHAAGYETNLAVLSPIPEPEKVTSLLDSIGKWSYAARLKAPALLLAGQKSSSVLLSGVTPAQESNITFIGRRVEEGSYLAEKDGLLLGRELADSLGIGIGTPVKLMAQDSFGRPVARKFTLCGIYRTDLAAFNRSHAFLPLPTAQAFLGLEHGDISEIVVQMDPALADQTATVLARQLPEDLYQVRSWQQITPDLRQLIELNDATMQLLILIVFAIVAMGITNTMTTVIFERFRELGILSAIGTTPAGIVHMVVLESFFLGVLGTLLGSCAALAATLYLSRYGIDLSHFTSNNQYFSASHIIKAHLTGRDFFLANMITLTTALIAGIYPAWKAARLEPVKAIVHT